MKINLPNMLIVLRIVLIPVFLHFYFSVEPGESLYRLLALVVFLVASITDFLDGLLARRWNTVSNFGKLMDPLADKMLVCSALIALAARQEIAAGVAIIIICREFWVTALRQLALESGKRVIPASMWGKIKTFLQVSMIVALIAGMGTNGLLGVLGDNIAIILIFLTLIATILSAVEYTKVHKDVFKA